MLPVFSVILEQHKDDKNSSDRPMIRPQSLYCIYTWYIPSAYLSPGCEHGPAGERKHKTVTEVPG